MARSNDTGIILIAVVTSLCVYGVTAIKFHVSPTPGYKHSAFRLIVPAAALHTLHWHDALRHAAFLSLRRGISKYDGNALRTEMILWRHLTIAPVTPEELAKPVHEDADITTLATGVLVRHAGHLAFLPEDAILQSPRKVIALWNVLRVRHSGPGLLEPNIELYFTVQPASHLSVIDYADKHAHKLYGYKQQYLPVPNLLHPLQPIPLHPIIRPTVVPQIDGNVPVIEIKPNPNTRPPTLVPVSIYSNVPGQFYSPEFLAQYRNAIQKFLVKPPQNDDNLLAVKQVLPPNDPVYIIPTPRFVQPPMFPRLSQLLPQQNVPKLVNIYTQPEPTVNNDINEIEGREIGHYVPALFRALLDNETADKNKSMAVKKRKRKFRTKGYDTAKNGPDMIAQSKNDNKGIEVTTFRALYASLHSEGTKREKN